MRIRWYYPPPELDIYLGLSRTISFTVVPISWSWYRDETYWDNSRWFKLGPFRLTGYLNKGGKDLGRINAHPEFQKNARYFGGKMTWNYRVIRRKATPEEAELSEEEYCYTIREVFYDDEGKPELVSEEDTGPWGTTVDEIKKDVEWFSKALGQPVLNYEDF